MSRRIVEGKTRGNVSGSFPDGQAPVVTVPAPPTGTIYRDPRDGSETAIHDPMVIMNNDTIVAGFHTFNFFLRGTDVPGGQLNLNPAIGGQLAALQIANGAIGPGGFAFRLVGDMQIEVVMEDDTTTLAPVFITSFEDAYEPLGKLSVVAEVPRTEVATFNDGAAYVLAGPTAGEGTRSVILAQDPELFGSTIANADSVAHTMTVTLLDANAPDLVLWTQSVGSGLTFVGAAGRLPGIIELTAGQSLEIATATPTTTDDPYVLMQFTDRVG